VRGWLVIVAVLVFVVKQMGDMASKNELTADTFRPRNLIVLLAVFAGVFLISIGVGFFEWRTTRFRIDDTEIRINRTFITRRSDRIPFGKIQSVDVTQPFAARILGLASLTIDVGASQHKKIEYLSRRDAYRFRDLLITRSGRGAAATPGGSPTRQNAITPANSITTAPPGQLDRHPAGTATPPTSPAPASTPREGFRPGTSPSPLGGSQWLDRRRDEDVILTVPKGRFVLSQITSSAFLMLVLVFIISTVLTTAGGGSIFGVCFAYVLSIVGYLWTKLSKSWGLTLYRSGDGLKSVHGFTSLETRTIPVQRIQGVEITQSLLWRIWGYHSVHVTVLGNDGKTESDLLPGYGWAFPVGDGTVNVGLGMLNSSDAFQKTDYRSLMTRWLSHLPAQWGLTPDNQEGPIRGAALPMAFNRTPAYDRGLLLVGDAGGMVNPFNGEGIDYAMEAGELAATAIAQAHYRGMGSRSAERALQGYSIALRERFGGYFRLGTIFVKLIGDPRVMRLCTTYGLPHAALMRFVNKLLANLTDSRGGDVSDHVINALTRLAPST